MSSSAEQSSFHAPSSPKMSILAGDRRFSYDPKRADPIPASYLDASIPLNLPPRRSMKMLKDGSDFVWPDSAHALFVQGLQAWKVLTIGSKRTRAPRGEGKTDFLVRFLLNHGVERSKKQVASHLQVLRTEWRNLDNPVLLSLVDEAHSRSMSEPSLPPIATGSASTSSSVFEDSPDPNNDRTTPVSGSPHSQSPLHQAPPPSYSGPSQSLHIATQNPIRIHSSPDVSASWQLAHHPTYPTWSSPHPTTHTHTMSRHSTGFSIHNPQNIYHDTSYDSPVSPHDYEGNPGSLTPPSQGYVNAYYNTESGPAFSNRQISLPLPGHSSPQPTFHAHHPQHPYNQNFAPNPNTSTYVYPTRTHNNDYRLMNYPTQSYTSDVDVQQQRRPSHPYLSGSPMTYDRLRSPNDPHHHHPDFNSPRNQ